LDLVVLALEEEFKVEENVGKFGSNVGGVSLKESVLAL
jgi:hypothetical protein